MFSFTATFSLAGPFPFALGSLAWAFVPVKLRRFLIFWGMFAVDIQCPVECATRVFIDQPARFSDTQAQGETVVAPPCDPPHEGCQICILNNSGPMVCQFSPPMFGSILSKFPAWTSSKNANRAFNTRRFRLLWSSSSRAGWSWGRDHPTSSATGISSTHFSPQLRLFKRCAVDGEYSGLTVEAVYTVF